MIVLSQVICFLVSLVSFLSFSNVVPAAEKKTDQWPVKVKQETSQKSEELSLKKRIPPYRAYGSRDPFVSLVEVVGDTKSSGSTSFLENIELSRLKLVGLIHDTKGKLALFEDDKGKGYVLRQGDRIKDAVLNVIGKETVIFNSNRFGRWKVVEMELQDLGKAESGSIQFRTRTVSKPSKAPKTVPKPKGTSLKDSKSEKPAFSDNQRERTNRSPSSFHLLGPTRGEKLYLGYKLDWSDTVEEDKSDEVRYILYIYNFGIPVLVRDDLRSSEYTLSAADKLPTGLSLYWKVKAKDTRGGETWCVEKNWNFQLLPSNKISAKNLSP